MSIIDKTRLAWEDEDACMRPKVMWRVSCIRTLETHGNVHRQTFWFATEKRARDEVAELKMRGARKISIGKYVRQ